jgi:FkbM family methyltransferase
MRPARSSIRSVIHNILASEGGRRQPWAVLRRVAAWQLWRRILRRPLRFRTVTGAFLRLIPGASDSLSGFWYETLPDFEELAFTLHLLRPGDLFVDVGANQGGWSLVAAGRGARVIAFEPVPLTCDRLRANLACNVREVANRVEVRQSGLGTAKSTARFTADLDVGNHQLDPQQEDGAAALTVEIVSADDALRGTGPVVMKIDVEGFELAVLKGAREVLSDPRLRAVVMETFRPQRAQDPALLLAESLLREHGLLAAGYDPWTRTLEYLTDPAAGGQNTIYVKAIDEVRQRVRDATPLEAFGQRI